ncbi:helix-turn-helix domain-containing protein [Lysobacter yangpyeongensis]|uniref:Helix-turn-helix domain-containing protein n=1 Tax=Lysobacter yangpyeongensis TaxID=346182 RepID=A0ABW0SM78_9GAMM
MDARIECTILMIATRFREPLALPVLAVQAGLSPFHLHRLFKSETGETPAAYLSRIRLAHAAHLMVVLPDAPLVQIALESGFTSAATFARAFRQHFGETASDYRRRRQLAVNGASSTPALSVHRLPARRLRVQRCALEEDALSAAYNALRRRCTEARRTAVGVFVDAPFHQHRAGCRHYLGLESDSTDHDAHALELPGGLYARVPVSGDLDALSREILRFKSEQLDPSAYAIASTLAFEQVELPHDAPFDYRASQRWLFIKVRRKHEPAL